MKKIIATGITLISLLSHAEVRNPISAVSQMNFDGTQLTLTYQTGGGCQEHVADLEVKLENVSQFQAVATVQVVDVTQEEDFCEAIVGVSASVNLQEILRVKAKEMGIKNSMIEIQLPKVRMILD